MGETNWFCVYTQTNQEVLARNELRRNNFPTFMPILVTDDKERLLFPRYLFVQLDLDAAWQRAAYQRGVVRLLGPRSVTTEPYQVPPSVMAALLERCGDDHRLIILSAAPPPPEPITKAPKAIRPQAIQLPAVVGDRLRVVGGPFFNLQGLCTLSDRKRVEALISFMGSEQRMVFKPSQVERYAKTA